MIFHAPLDFLTDVTEETAMEICQFLSWMEDVVHFTRDRHLELCLHWDPLHEWDDACGWLGPERADEASTMAAFARITSKARLTLVTRSLTIHISQERAVLSGLFGLLGEEACQLVDVSDTDTIKRYHDFWKSTLPMRYNKAKLETRFWCVFKKQRRGSENMESVSVKWLQRLLFALWLTDRNAPPGAFPFYQPGLLSQNSHPSMKPDETHPWVIEKRRLLPVFRSTVCFRFCHSAACLRRHNQVQFKFRERTRKEILRGGVLRGKQRWWFQGRGRWRWRSWAKGKWKKRRCMAPRLLNQVHLKRSERL